MVKEKKSLKTNKISSRRKVITKAAAATGAVVSWWIVSRM